MRPGRRRVGVLAWFLWLGTAMAMAGAPIAEPPLPALFAAAGLSADDLAPDHQAIEQSPTRSRQLPLYRDLMREPLAAPRLAGTWLRAAQKSRRSTADLFRWAASLAGAEANRPSTSHAPPNVRSGDGDPLASALAWLAPIAAAANAPWPPPLPGPAAMPEPFRGEAARLLGAIGRAHAALDIAFARLPVDVDAKTLRSALLDARAAPERTGDLAAWLPLVDRGALLAGMADLVAAAQRMQRFIATTPLPRIAWQLQTPLGAIIIDTTGRDNAHRLSAPMLVIDVGGNDRYEFAAAPPARHVAVVLDHGGNDRYEATAAGADPSAAALGYGILWDGKGNDEYVGAELAQAAALFGAALLVDAAGTNRFTAAGFAQAFAIGGAALLLSSPGNDEFTAQSHAQASAGPEGVAVLLDPGGNERYRLTATPLSMPSPQLPTHNTSMGQGAGRGFRAAEGDTRSATGGIGLLMDLAGDDHYEAQVFAQGAGFYEGVGALIDAAGRDRFEAAWYAMGAAAHRAAGVFLKLGGRSDRYRATHSTSLGAAHDLSMAYFYDDGGDDRYALGDLGLGAAHDHSVALFVDASGRDRYEVGGSACRAFGVAQLGEPSAENEDLPAAGLFMDLGGSDRYPIACRQPRNGSVWAGPRTRSAPHLRGEAAAGVDGEYRLPTLLEPNAGRAKARRR